MSEFYRFKPEDAELFKQSLGARAKRVHDQLVFGFCPYCGGGASKDRETFAISMITGQFECKRSSCSRKGNMITLARDFADQFQLAREVQVYHNINGVRDNFKKFRDAHRAIEVRDGAVAYLGKRGISEAVVRKYEVTTAPDNENIIVFPFRNEKGELVFVKYRNAAFDPEKDKNKEWTIAGNYQKVLFGMPQCEDFSTLVITEGQIDSLSLAEAGIKNAVSVPTGKNGFTWRPIVWDWLCKFDEIVVFGDREGDEITLAKEITQSFPKVVRIVQPEDYHGCKDANEILQKFGKGALVAAVKNAKASVSLRIKNLAEVEDVNLENLKAYPTGIKSLDESIGRGFHEGELIVLTGQCGEGKSTFASQIVANMLQNGLKCFCYSGELNEWMFKAWLDKQITCGNAGYRDMATAWYDGKCMIYDNSCVYDEEETIFDLISEAVKKLGCKFVLVDNLMTAMEDKPSEDIYRQQADFVKRLTKFARAYNIIILLVAHPRKNSDTSNDSISGSGDIVNRANLVLRYQRDRDHGTHTADGGSRIMITKNRLTGILNDNGIAVKYWPESMRITEFNDRPYLMLDDHEEFVEATEEEEIPF